MVLRHLYLLSANVVVENGCLALVQMYLNRSGKTITTAAAHTA